MPTGPGLTLMAVQSSRRCSSAYVRMRRSFAEGPGIGSEAAGGGGGGPGGCSPPPGGGWGAAPIIVLRILAGVLAGGGIIDPAIPVTRREPLQVRLFAASDDPDAL